MISQKNIAAYEARIIEAYKNKNLKEFRELCNNPLLNFTDIVTNLTTDRNDKLSKHTDKQSLKEHATLNYGHNTTEKENDFYYYCMYPEKEEENWENYVNRHCTHPFALKKDTKVGMAIGLLIATVLVITASVDTPEANELRKFFYGIANTICKAIFGTNETTPKSALTCAHVGIFSIFSAGAIIGGGLLATPVRNLTSHHKPT